MNGELDRELLRQFPVLRPDDSDENKKQKAQNFVPWKEDLTLKIVRTV